ncbi:MAG: hypothetical protein RIB67_01405 [Miltoncostaeaceae bacterium]
MGGRTKLLVAGGVLAWLGSIGALDPRLWKSTFERERERLPRQIREAREAGKREAARAEAALDQQVQDAFKSAGPS